MDPLANTTPEAVAFINSLTLVKAYGHLGIFFLLRDPNNSEHMYLMGYGDLSDDRSVQRDIFYEVSRDQVTELEREDTPYLSIIQKSTRVFVADGRLVGDDKMAFQATEFISFDLFAEAFADLLPTDDSVVVVFDQI